MTNDSSDGSDQQRYVVSALGHVSATFAGEQLDLGGPKQRLVLALLMASPDQVVATDRLIDGLWGDEPPATARKALQMHVSNLRRSLGESFPLRTASGGYLVQSADLDYDVAEFEASVTRATALLRTDPTVASSVLSRALDSWRGPAFADLQDEAAVAPEIARLGQLRLTALERRIDADLRLGRHAELVGHLETLTIEYPFHERFREQQMLALYRSGRQAEALRAYDRTRSTLVDELGVDPSPSLQALHSQILQQAPELEYVGEPGEPTYAFLATDLEDSTALWEADPDAMQLGLARHDELLAIAVETYSGTVFKGTGDGIYAVFASASDAIQAAVDAQLALTAEPWPTDRPLAVRMAVDEGPASAREGDYFGPVLNRVSRIMSSGHGRQLLIPASLTAQSPLPVRELGTADYKGVGRIEVGQVEVPGFPTEFAMLRTDRAPTGVPRSGFGRAIRGYELREQLGEGSSGIVFRAYQASIGREVAVKVIRPELANRSGFVKRFEAEAQFVAQLEHPHIVPLYDYWRDPDGAYLVMQLLRGASLADSLDRSPWRPSAALRLLDQIGTALDYAHRHGVLHRDLKPANVLLDGDGNAFLSDFGIATDHVDAVGLPAESSVAYISPEELAGQPIGTATDVYGLTLLAYETLTASRPQAGGQPEPVADLRPELPPAIDRVLARGTHLDPTQRYSRIAEFLRDLRQAFGAEGGAQSDDPPVEVRNPFKGLRAFKETDAADFFGRDELVAELIEHVAHHRFTAVVGPSGSGKSSVVRAGLLPEIRRGALDVAGDVMITEMYPGSYPFEELESALVKVAVTPTAGTMADLLGDDRGMLRVAKQILPDDDSELVLVIDQFEELFSLTTDADVRQRFLSSLVEVARDERSRVRIVVTMRADYFDRPLEHAEFGDVLRSGLVPVAVPREHELAAAISRPAGTSGLEFEAGLVARIVRDVADQPGALPLLQYALTTLVERRQGRLLDVEAYEQIGGVEGALAIRAEEIFQALSPRAKHAAREVFLRLVRVDDHAGDTRRRAGRSELESLGFAESLIEEVVSAFGGFRLIGFDRDPVSRGQTVEVAHEALLREWPRYQDWIAERREALLVERRLESAALEWDAAGRPVDLLVSGGRLQQFGRWADGEPVAVGEVEQSFLLASRDQSNAELIQERKRSQRLRRLVSGVAVALVVALIAGGLALVQSSRADDEAQRANEEAQRANDEAERANDAATLAEEQTVAANDSALAADLARMRAQAVSEVVPNPPLAALLAAEAYATDASPESAGALQRVLTGVEGRQATLIDGPPPAYLPNFAALSADQNVLAVTTFDVVDVWDLDTGTLALRHNAVFAASDIRFDGKLVAVDPSDVDEIELIEIASGDIVGRIPAAGCRVVQFSPDGNQVAIVADDSIASTGCNGFSIAGTLQIWDVSDPTRPQLDHVNTDGGVLDVWWAPDGDGYLSLTGDARLQFRNSTTHEVDWTHEYDLTSGATLGEYARSNSGALFRSDSRSVVVETSFNANAGSLLFTFDTQSGAVIGTPTSTTFLRSMNWWNEEETELVGTLGPSGVTVIDLEASTVVEPAPIENPNATSVWVDHNNGRIVISSFVGIEIFSLDGTSVLERRVGLTEEQSAVKAEFNPQVLGSLTADGSQLWTSMNDPSQQLAIVEWDLTTEPASEIDSQDAPGLAFDQGGSTMLFGLTGVQVIDGGHEPLGPVIDYGVIRAPFGAWYASSDGSRHAPVFVGTTAVDIYDTESGERIFETDLFATDEEIFASIFSFSADGVFMLRWLQTAVGEDWALFNTETGEIVEINEPAPTSPPHLAGRTIYSNPPDSFDFVRRDVETLEIVGPPLVGHTIAANEIADDPDADRIVTQGINGTIRVWDRATGVQIGGELAIGRQNAGNDFSIAQDGNLIGVSLDTEFALWNYDIETWPALACQIAGRNMTQREWDDFGPEGAEYRVTCPQFAPGS